MRHIAHLKRKSLCLVILVSGLLLASAVLAQAYTPRYVWVTTYYDASGNPVGVQSYGDCPLGDWGTHSGTAVTHMYDCDGELPY